MGDTRRTITLTEAQYRDLFEGISAALETYIECNCSYDSRTEPEHRCDGSCTHAQLVRGLAALMAQPAAAENEAAS